MEGSLSWYFAYGSNMNVMRLFDDRLKPVGVSAGERVAGRLDGWQLAFNKRARAPLGAGAGNIVVAPGEVVHGTLNLLPAAGFEVLRVESILGLGSVALQLWQDATLHQVPRPLRRTYVRAVQAAIGWLERRRAGRPSDDACVHVVVARRT